MLKKSDIYLNIFSADSGKETNKTINLFSFLMEVRKYASILSFFQVRRL